MIKLVPPENGTWPGNNGYGPALWNACEKFGLYMAVGAEPAVLEMPIPFIGVLGKPAFDTLQKTLFVIIIITITIKQFCFVFFLLNSNHYN